VLLAVRPDPASGSQFLAALSRAWAGAGISQDWPLVMVTAPGGRSFIWARDRHGEIR
jgi:hypothetical protein